MVRTTLTGGYINGKSYAEFAGLSSDSKPTKDLITGCLFLEVDTGDVYAFDEESVSWYKIAELGGSGS